VVSSSDGTQPDPRASRQDIREEQMATHATLRLAWPALAALLLAGCATTRIGQIQADPTRYRNKTISVNGTVTTSFGALGTGFYEIEDSSGKIYVISNSGVPSRGSSVSVRGTVFSGATVAGRSLGTAIRERSHKIR
jgi:hypothetical protein